MGETPGGYKGEGMEGLSTTIGDARKTRARDEPEGRDLAFLPSSFCTLPPEMGGGRRL